MLFFTVLIYIILSFLVGSLLIGLGMPYTLITPDLIANYLKEVLLASSTGQILFVFIGLGLIIFCLVYLQTCIYRSKRNKAITFESSQGNVSITLFAIEDMLKKMLEERKEISNVRPKINLKKSDIEVVIKSVLTSEVNLVEFTQKLQKQAREKLQNILGEEKQVKINLIIKKVSLRGKKNLEEEPEIPFRNYE